MPKILHLDLNERLSPPEPAAVKALCQQARRVNRYVRGDECEEIKKSIAKVRRINPAEIVLFNGSWHGLMIIFSFLFHEKDEVLVPVPTFPFYLSLVEHQQFKIKKISGRPCDITAKNIGQNFNAQTKGLYLVNPTNPFGEVISQAEINKILSLAIKKNVLVVLDEAYGELADIDSSRLIKKYSNLIILKSGSKAYGLGGARAGYAMTNKKLAEILESCRGPSYTLSAPAISALSAFYRQIKSFNRYVEEIKKIREEFKDFLKQQQCQVFDSRVNFVTFAVKDSPRFVRALAKKNIIIKDLIDYPDGRGLTKNLVRVTIPPKEDWLRLKKALEISLRAK